MPREKDSDPNYDLVMRLFGGACVICGATYGVTVHEMTPKSLAPKSWKAIDNRVPLCQEHHDYVHRLSRKDRDEFLLPARERALKFYTS